MLAGAAGSLLSLGAIAPDAHAATSCGYDVGTGTVTVTLAAGGDLATVWRGPGDAIQVNGTSCGTATVANTTTINANDTSGGGTELRIDLGGGAFENGGTEIQFHPNLGSGSDVLSVVAPFAQTQHLRIGAAGVDLDADASIDVTADAGVDTYKATLGAGGGSVFGIGTSSSDTPTSVPLDVTGGDNSENIIGGNGADHLRGGGGADNVLGFGGSDNLEGGAGNDFIGGDGELLDNPPAYTAGNDTLHGDDDNDYLGGEAGNDTIDGGTGADTADYETAPSGVTLQLATVGDQDTQGAGTDSLQNMESAEGSSHNDQLTGTSGSNTIEGGAGNDSLEGAGGVDTLTYAGATQRVNVSLVETAAQDTGGAGTDTVAGFENLTGTEFSGDVLEGDNGDNVLNGINGGDTVSYESATANLNVRLDMHTPQNTQGAGTDTLVDDFQGLTGGSGDDHLFGTALPNAMDGGPGHDTIEGGTGPGDLIDYSWAPSAVQVNLGSTTPTSTGGGGMDVVTGVENVRGSAFDDQLTGDGNANQLVGGDGNDTLDGAGGADLLIGFSGADSLLGGAGGDSLVGDDLAGTLNDPGANTPGDDFLDPGPGADVDNAWGGGGTDTVTYASAPAGVGVNLETGVVSGGSGSDLVQTTENVIGTAFADDLTGSSGDNVLNPGSDSIGADVLDGAGGNDTASYVDAPAPVSIDLSITDPQATGVGNDTFTDIDNLIGTNQHDVLIGNADANRLDGRGGADELTGDDGTDDYDGGAGDDTIKARDGHAEQIACGLGPNDTAQADTDDTTTDCEAVDKPVVQSQNPPPGSGGGSGNQQPSGANTVAPNTTSTPTAPQSGQGNGPSGAPVASIASVTGAKMKSALKTGLTMVFNLDRPSNVTVEAQLDPKLAARLHLAKKTKPVVVGKGSASAIAAGKAKVTIKFNAKAKKKLAKAKKIDLVLVAKVKDAAGKTTTVTKRMTLKR